MGGKNSRWFGNAETILDVEELNIVEFPLALLSRHVPDGRQVIRFEDNIKDQSTGQRIHRSLEISANASTKLPNWWDQDFLLALKVLTNRKNGWTDPVVEFSAYEILKLMRLPNEKKNRRMIAKSFDNWQGVRFKYSHWRRGEEWIAPKAFCLIQDYDLTRTNRKKPDSPQVFAWSRILFESMQDAHVKPFDVDFYFGLKSPTARRCCRFLEKRFYNRAEFKAPLIPFCVNKLGMSDKYRWAADFRSRLNPAYDELVATGFLEHVDKEDRFAAHHGTPGVTFKRGKRKSRSQLAARKPAASVCRPSPTKSAKPVLAPLSRALERFLAGLPNDDARRRFEEEAAQQSPMWDAYLSSKQQQSELFPVWRRYVLEEAWRQRRAQDND